MLNKMPKHLLKYIYEFVEPTEEQLETWKMYHLVDGYYKVLKEIEDTIVEIKIGRNGKMKCVFSLFSLSLIDTEIFYEDDEDEIIEFYNYNYGFDYLDD